LGEGSNILIKELGGNDFMNILSCPVHCNYEIVVDAMNDKEAVARIIAEGVFTADNSPDAPMTEDQLKNMVRSE
jgi:hypothetical protein